MLDRDTLHKLLVTVAGSALLGMSAAVIDSQRTNAVQDDKLTSLTAREVQQSQVLDKLNASVVQLSVDVAVLSDRLQSPRRAARRLPIPTQRPAQIVAQGGS